MKATIKQITDAKFSGPIFFFVLAVVYGVVPLYQGLIASDPYMLKLSGIAAVACVAGLGGFYLPIIDRQFTDKAWRIPVPPMLLHAAIWIAFGVFVAVTFATADSIPLVKALQGGASLVDLDIARAEFLKTRQGWEAALGYFSGAFVGAILPYSMAVLFSSGSRFRYGAMGTFFFYAESYLQKALFLQIVIPLAYLVVQRKIWNYRGLALLLAGTLGLLYVNTILARGTDQFTEFETLVQTNSTAPTGVPKPPAREFLSSNYKPRSNVEHLVWRAGAVPIFTARDALIVHDEQFGGRLLMGATSSFTAKLLGLERVNYDAAVHGYQWGETAIGRSNSVYLTEAFVNFGWLGVAVFSFVVGQLFRCFWKSNDFAFKAMWPLFTYNIIQASLIGSLLSSGFAVVFFIGLLLKEQPEARVVPVYTQ